MLKTYSVQIPIAAYIIVTVEAKSADEAKDKAFDLALFRIVPDDPDVCEIGDVELIHRINSGNVCHAPCQEISVTEMEC